MKAVVAAFNQEKALVGALSVLTNLRMELFQALVSRYHCYYYYHLVLLGVVEGRGRQWRGRGDVRRHQRLLAVQDVVLGPRALNQQIFFTDDVKISADLGEVVLLPDHEDHDDEEEEGEDDEGGRHHGHQGLHRHPALALVTGHHLPLVRLRSGGGYWAVIGQSKEDTVL